MNKLRLIFVTLMVMTLAGCGSEVAFKPVGTHTIETPGGTPQVVPSTIDPSGPTVIVFAAASLTGAFLEISADFEAANPGVKVNINFAGSQVLRTWLEQGAQADVFASADHKNMDLIVADHLVAADAVRDFATNSLIVILPPGNPGNVMTLADLARPKLKLVLADVSVPAGDYARQVLIKMSLDAEYGKDFSNKVLANVVSNETDVKQVVTKVELGEADAGIVYASDAVATPHMIDIPIPATFNIVANYPIAVLNNAPQPKLAQEFVEYVASPAGQLTLKEWGFNSVGH